MAIETWLTVRLPVPVLDALEDEAGEQFLPISRLVKFYVLQGLAKAGRPCRADTTSRFRRKHRPEQAQAAA
jgi:hypothetical protein